jgi:Soluble P-type ATPase
VIKISIPGREQFELHHLVLDMNGTLSVDGRLIEGITERLAQLTDRLHIYLLTADTFGTGAQVARDLGIELFTVSPANGSMDKANFIAALDPSGAAAIGNGTNDMDMFKQASLSIAVIGREGCSAAALLSADIAVNNINDALDLLLNPLRLVATLRK